MREDGWERPLGFPAVGDVDVQVWRVALAKQFGELVDLERLLDLDEAARAHRFRFTQDRNRFTVSHGLLRILLASHLGTSPGEVLFEYTTQGKPLLAPLHRSSLRFNMSHSGDFALFAVARGREVGVDVEEVKPAIANESIPERFFTPAEAALIRATPADRRAALFFECWVRKEAAVKAWGTGLSLPLDRYDVSPGTSGAIDIECPGEIAGMPKHWSLRTLHAGLGYQAALVVEGRESSLRRFDWPERTSP